MHGCCQFSYAAGANSHPRLAPVFILSPGRRVQALSFELVTYSPYRSLRALAQELRALELQAQAHAPALPGSCRAQTAMAFEAQARDRRPRPTSTDSMARPSDGGADSSRRPASTRLSARDARQWRWR